MIDISFDPYRYKTLGDFHDSEAFIVGLLGPFGSGKSSAAITKLFYSACTQTPHNGIRYSRTAITRNTYSQLETTTIPTFSRWIPENKFPVLGNAPCECRVKIKDIGDGTGVDWTVWFLALDRPQDIVKIKSMDLTQAWLNEACEMDEEVFHVLTGRVGRYPDPSLGGCRLPQIIMDTNAPDEDNWWFKIAEESDPEFIASLEEQLHQYGLKQQMMQFFSQPGALTYNETTKQYDPNPLAENIENLNSGYGYYYRQLAGKKQNWIDRYILGLYAATDDGKPVYPEYKDEIHYSRVALKANKEKPMLLGFDYGLTPACVLLQPDSTGRVVAHKEIVSFDMAMEEFLAEAVIPTLNEEYPMYKFVAIGDPSEKRVETDARTAVGLIRKAGIKIKPAYTNQPGTRTNDVRHFLLKKDGFILNPGCKYLRRGFQGQYKFKRLAVSATRFSTKPEKNIYSHIHDALQYGLGEFKQMAARPKQSKRKPINYRFV